MDKFRFLELVKNSESCSAEDETSLVHIAETFPYCQSAYVILAKSSHDKGGMHADTHLHAAAIRIPQREHLRKLLQAENTLRNLAYISAEKKNTEKYQKSNLNTSVMDSIDKKNNSLLEELEANLRNLQLLKKNANFFDNFKIEKEVFADEVTPNLKLVMEEVKTDIELQIEQPTTLVLSDNNPNTQPEVIIESLENFSLEIINSETNEIPILEEKIVVIDQIELENKPQELINEHVIEGGNAEIDLFLFQNKSNLVVDDFNNLRVEDTEISNSPTDENPIDLLLSYIDYLDKKRNGEEFDYIDKFIQNEPILAKFNPNELPETPLLDLASNSSAISDDIASENLAVIFLKQRKKEKALEIYKILSLKNPEKSAYFASKISEIENS